MLRPSGVRFAMFSVRLRAAGAFKPTPWVLIPPISGEREGWGRFGLESTIDDPVVGGLGMPSEVALFFDFIGIYSSRVGRGDAKCVVSTTRLCGIRVEFSDSVADGDDATNR